MKTYIIKASDLDPYNFYIGNLDLNNLDGNLECEKNLGTVNFKENVRVKGYIRFGKESGIEAILGVFAAREISVGYGVRAGGWISAGEGISSKLSITAELGISAKGDISAGNDISAGYGISAGNKISAGMCISAGFGISARDEIFAKEGISAGHGISAKTIRAGARIFAGICSWGTLKETETEIRCEKVEGTVIFGKLVITKPIEEIR